MPGKFRTLLVIPRPAAVIGVLAVVVSLVAAASRFGGHGGAPPQALPVSSADLLMRDQEDGSIVVTQAGRSSVLMVVPPATNGFLRVILSGLVRERRREGMGAPSQPFHLTRWSDGRLTLNDDATGKLIELNAFGPDNAGAFARLLDLSRQQPP